MIITPSMIQIAIFNVFLSVRIYTASFFSAAAIVALIVHSSFRIEKGTGNLYPRPLLILVCELPAMAHRPPASPNSADL